MEFKPLLAKVKLNGLKMPAMAAGARAKTTTHARISFRVFDLIKSLLFNSRIMSDRLDIDNQTLAAIIGHAERAWPEECCGLLIGRQNGEAIQITGYRESANVSGEDRTRRYELDSRVLVRALLEFRRSAEQVVGFYHSHPKSEVGSGKSELGTGFDDSLAKGRAIPSNLDRASAWPGKAYLIVGMHAGRAASVRAWMPDDQTPHWTELLSEANSKAVRGV